MLKVPRVLKVLVLMVLMVLVVLVVPGVLSAQGEALRPDGVITGQVVDGVTGKPMAAAVVAISGPQFLLLRADEQPARVLTGADGRFVFRGLDAGILSVTATKGGYAEGEPGRWRPGGDAPALTLTAGAMTADVTVPMWRYGVVTGAVVDEAGEPVVTLQVHALKRTTGSRQYTVAQTTFTDDRGIYRFGNLVPGDYLVLASSAGISVTASPRVAVYPPTFYPSAAAPAQASGIRVGKGDERTGIDLPIAPVLGARVSGILFDDGDPVDTMSVDLVPAGTEGIPFDIMAAHSHTDGAGNFTFPAVVPGRYFVRSATRAAKDMGVVNMPLTVTADDIDNLVVTMRPTLSVTAHPQYEGVTPPPGKGSLASMGVPFILESAEGTRATFTGSAKIGEGVMTMGGFLSGRYRVRVPEAPPGWLLKGAMLDGVDVSETAFELNKDVTDLALVFTDRWGGVNGRVEEAAADTSVLFFTADSTLWNDAGPESRRFRTTHLDPKGQFSIGSVLPGDYYVVAVSDAQAADWRDPASLESLARVATQVSTADGESKTVLLRVKDVR